MVECGWGGREIDPATWQPFELQDGPSLWGTNASGSAIRPRVAREMRMRAAASGLRAPVQVMDGNYQADAGDVSVVDGVSKA